MIRQYMESDSGKTIVYTHQRKIISDDPKKCGLFLGTGTGKTRTALLLARGKTLIIAPKTQVEDQNWQREAAKLTLSAEIYVISKERFRRDALILPRFDTVIVDEAHTCLGVSPNIRFKNKKAVPKASQLFDALDAYLARTKPERLYLCTATVMRSPMTVWGAAHILGKDWDWYKFRSTFYAQLPMPGRTVFTVKKNPIVKEQLARLVKKLGYVGRLEDFFDVPEQTFKTIYTRLSKEQQERLATIALEYPDPLVRLTKEHQIENGVLMGDEFSDVQFFDNEKLDKIIDYAYEFPRMIVFAKYRAQIEQIALALKKLDKKIFILTGDTRNRGDVLREAQNTKEYVFIAQSQVSAGWELPDCPVMVFASRTYSFTDFVQAEGRIQRANSLKKNLYITLVVRGGIDEAVDEALKNKKDFDERLYAQRG